MIPFGYLEIFVFENFNIVILRPFFGGPNPAKFVFLAKD